MGGGDVWSQEIDFSKALLFVFQPWANKTTIGLGALIKFPWAIYLFFIFDVTWLYYNLK